tara:strand:- start:95744 stop:98470 length:2727 start_codon:yes stop_codon:yes gene_type:complete
MLAACSSGDSPESQLEKARVYYEAGELKSATIELKSLLQTAPNNAEARLLLGRTAYQQGDMRDAEFQLTKASRLGLDSTSVVPMLAKVLLALNSYEQLRAISLQDLDQEAQASVLASQGLAELQQGNKTEGQILISKAFELAPESHYVAVAMSRMLLDQSEPDYDGARSMLDSVVVADPGDANAWSALAKLEVQEQQLEAAEQAYNKAIEGTANNSADMLRRTMTRIQLKKYDLAQKDIDILIKRLPNSPSVYYAQGLIHMHTGNFPDALSAFEIALWDDDNFPQALLYSGMINLQEGNFNQAEAMANGYLAKNIDDVAGRKLLAATKLRQGLFLEAEQAIRPAVEGGSPDLQALNMLARSLAAQGKSDEYIEVMTQIVSIDPDSASAQARLGLGLITSGAREGGLEHLEKSLELDPELQQADVLTVLTYLQEKKFPEAIRASRDYKRRNPGTVSPYILAGRVYLEAGEPDAAVDEFESAREIDPGNPGACLSLAAIALQNKDIARARAYFAEILEHYENHLPTLMQLSAMEGLEGNEPLMLELLERAIKAHPGEAEPRLVMARYYLAHGKGFDAENLLNEISEEQKKQANVLEVTALTQMVNNNYPEARTTLETLLRLTPNAANVHHQLADVYAGLGMSDDAQAELERAVELSPNDFYIRLANARWSLQAGDTDRFNDHLEALKTMQPEHPAVMELEYVAAKKNGDKERELALSQSLLEVAPGTRNMLRVAQRKWSSGDRQGSLEVQEQWQREHPEDIASYLPLAVSYGLEGRTGEAAATYKKMLAKDADNVIALNNLAWLLREEQPEEALEFARKAEKLRPESYSVIDTLAMVQLANGKTKEARKAMDRVLRSDPSNPTYRYHSILVVAAEGDKNKAGQQLEALLAETANFPEKPEAVIFLEQLKE